MSKQLTQEEEAEHQLVRSVKEAVADTYLALDFVTGVGVGFGPRVHDEDTPDGETLALRIYVDPQCSFEDKARLPSKVRGVPVAIVEASFEKLGARQEIRSFPDEFRESIAPMADAGRYDPLVGGISVGPSRSIDGYYLVGTLGVMATNTANNQPVMLSNYHVLCGADGGAAVGDTICQPSRVDQWFQYCSGCARLERWHVGNVRVNHEDVGVDVAIASLTDRSAREGFVTELDEYVNGTSKAALNDRVVKRGRTTEETTGVVKDVSLDLRHDFGVGHENVVMRNQILVEPAVGSTFIDSGDSGSLLVKTEGVLATGLCWAKTGNDWGVASPISAVLAQMEIGL